AQAASGRLRNQTEDLPPTPDVAYACAPTYSALVVPGSFFSGWAIVSVYAWSGLPSYRASPVPPAPPRDEEDAARPPDHCAGRRRHLPRRTAVPRGADAGAWPTAAGRTAVDDACGRAAARGDERARARSRGAARRRADRQSGLRVRAGRARPGDRGRRAGRRRRRVPAGGPA